VLLTRIDGQARAIMKVCLHLGGPLERDGDELVCSRRNARSSLDGGSKLAGPGHPDLPLLHLPIKVIDGVVNYVHKD